MFYNYVALLHRVVMIHLLDLKSKAWHCIELSPLTLFNHFETTAAIPTTALTTSCSHQTCAIPSASPLTCCQAAAMPLLPSSNLLCACLPTLICCSPFAHLLPAVLLLPSTNLLCPSCSPLIWCYPSCPPPTSNLRCPFCPSFTCCPPLACCAPAALL